MNKNSLADRWSLHFMTAQYYCACACFHIIYWSPWRPMDIAVSCTYISLLSSCFIIGDPDVMRGISGNRKNRIRCKSHRNGKHEGKLWRLLKCFKNHSILIEYGWDKYLTKSNVQYGKYSYENLNDGFHRILKEEISPLQCKAPKTSSAHPVFLWQRS